MYKIKFLNGKTKEFNSLVEANLEGANLERADLRQTNLKRANLEGADLSHTCVTGFYLGKHFGFYHQGYVKIGCVGHSIDYWLDNITEIGNEHGYSEAEVELYKAQLNLLKKFR